ncbi:hypothetical protein Tco_0845466 [Tanacetum coccineum]
MLLFSTGVTIGGGGLNFPGLAARISLGVLVRGVNLLDPRPFADLGSQTSALKCSALTGPVPSMMRDLSFCQQRVVNLMHECEDPHALGGSLHASDFHLESFHELLDGIFIPLLDIVDFDGIFDILLLLHELC